MFRSISFQGVLLLLQLGLIVWIFSPQLGGQQQLQQATALLSVDTGTIDAINISDSEGNQVALSRQQDRWILPQYHQLAVNTASLNQLLDKLKAARLDWPVAQTEEAAGRFQVSSSSFKRKVQLQSGPDNSATIYLGDSPGLRKIYVRKDGDLAIHTIELGLHMVPATAQQWFDKSLLKPAGTISQIEAEGWILEKQGDDWHMKDMSEGWSLDQDRVINMVNYLQYPQVSEVIDEKAAASVKSLTPIARYWVKSGDAQVVYELYKSDSTHILKSSLSELYFKVPEFAAKNIADVKRETLLKQVPEVKASDAETDNQKTAEPAAVPVTQNPTKE